MRVNKKLLPIKAHYFCFMGCVSPIIPFVFVVGTQLGIPVFVTGVLTSVSLMAVVLMKPLLAGIADAYPSYRRTILLSTVIVMVASLSSLYFIPPMRDEALVIQGQMVRVVERGTGEKGMPESGTAAGEVGTQYSVLGEALMLLAQDNGRCLVWVGWECEARKWSNHNTTTTTTLFQNTFNITALGLDHKFEVVSGEDGGVVTTLGGSEELPRRGVEGALERSSRGRLYRLEGVNISMDLLAANIWLECGGGRREGVWCAVWYYWQFWGYAFLLLIGIIAFKTGVSVNDAITMDILGKEGDYGVQRAWGTVGWGVMGMLSGVIIDWWSGSSLTQDYTPTFIICFVLGSIDVLLSATAIRVPKIETETDLLKKVWPILRQPRFLVFCTFVFLSGAFNLLANSFIFVMQEDMLRGTPAMRHIKLIHGFTLLVQCGSEAPFMFINKWFMRKLGAHYVTSLVFCLYIIRLLGLSVAGTYWPVWMTLVVELLNGPCYGLGYTAVVNYSSCISPPGTSTTLQSLTNICYESLGYGAALFAGGLLYSGMGGPKMYLVSGTVATLTFFLHLLSLRLILPPPKENNNEERPSSSEMKVVLKRLTY